MDDVVLAGGRHRERTWRHETFVTFARITAQQVEGDMSDEDYERFGRFIFGAVASVAKFLDEFN